MDEYSLYCFRILQSTTEGVTYLKSIGFTSDQDVIALGESKINEENRAGPVCVICGGTDTVQRSVQIRSADEGETTIRYCKKCAKQF